MISGISWMHSWTAKVATMGAGLYSSAKYTGRRNGHNTQSCQRRSPEVAQTGERQTLAYNERRSAALTHGQEQCQGSKGKRESLSNPTLAIEHQQARRTSRLLRPLPSLSLRGRTPLPPRAVFRTSGLVIATFVHRTAALSSPHRPISKTRIAATCPTRLKHASGF